MLPKLSLPAPATFIIIINKFPTGIKRLTDTAILTDDTCTVKEVLVPFQRSGNRW